ncbi:protein MTL1-like [Nicotiana sylvestris]|uniref:protein MTL1-like n=1 Tax=Nicotiana sylvestris TaxID=4096 RepID=UPI00388CC8FC
MQMVSLQDYIEFLQYKAFKQTSSKIASVVQTDSIMTCISQSSISESWVIDSGASDHISGNKSLFTSISYSQSLPTVTMANRSQTMATAIGQASPLLSLPLDSILYVSDSSFNLIAISRLDKSLKSVVSFLDDLVFIQECSTGRIIGKDKLAPRALKCIFLGYSRTQKGYRCYSPNFQRYLMPGDVTFFEIQSYFTSSGNHLDISEVLPVPSFGDSVTISHLSSSIAPIATPPPIAPVAALPPTAPIPPTIVSMPPPSPV